MSKQDRRYTTTNLNQENNQNQGNQQQNDQQALNQALDETKTNIQINADKAGREIPRYTQTVNEVQEQTIQAKDIVGNYIEYQKQVIR